MALYSRLNLAKLPESVQERIQREWSREFQQSPRFRSFAVILIVLIGAPCLVFKFFEGDAIHLSPTIAVAAAGTMVAGYIAIYVCHELPRRRFCANRVAQLGYCGNCGASVGATPGQCPACGAILPVVK